MLTVADAFELLLATIVQFDVTDVPIHEAAGLCLGQDVCSTSDSPPFNKSSMDGYAIRGADITPENSSLRVIEVITAGQVPRHTIGPREAAQIMTGAPMPDGADTVVKVEETTRSGDLVTIADGVTRIGANVIQRGASTRAGECVLRAGLMLHGARIGALAELGRSMIPIRRRPRVAILATGDELVAVDQQPGPGQIRNSNAVMLAAQIEAAGGFAAPLGIARDEQQDLREKIDQGLHSDILVLSGGVSMGTLDLVPSVLAEAGVREVFHKVEMKPGKPIWFGKWRADHHSSGQQPRTCYVFGLPGNPVSSLVCCELFVRAGIRQLMGIEPAVPQSIPAKLEHEYSSRGDRPTYHPAKLTWTPHGLAVTLIHWHGSSDLCGTAAANGMVCLPSGTRHYHVGESVDAYLW